MVARGPYEARRVRTTRGLAYELDADGESVLSWTLHPFHLGDDVYLRDPDGEPVLRITADDVDEYVDASFAVLDARDDSLLGAIRWNLRSLVRRHWGLLDPHGVEVATVVATSRFRSIVRQRWLRFVPYRYAFRDADGEHLGDLRGSIRPGRAFFLDLAGGDVVDRRLVVAASAIVDAAEFW